jgi:hypothetical protein
MTRHSVSKFVAVVAASFFVYLGTVSAIPAVGRHMADGGLQWLRCPVVSTCLNIYEAPVAAVVAIPGLSRIYDFLADTWCGISNTPDTTP